MTGRARHSASARNSASRANPLLPGSMRASTSAFFFQAEDGIRAYKVSGVQTCAFPICVTRAAPRPSGLRYQRSRHRFQSRHTGSGSMVVFEERNLCIDDGAPGTPEPFDVVFCRNVIMYLVPDA